jgi:hypothetical protein
LAFLNPLKTDVYAIITAMKASKNISTAPARGRITGMLCTTLSTTSTGWSSAVAWLCAAGVDMVLLSGIFANNPAILPHCRAGQHPCRASAMVFSHITVHFIRLRAA